MSRWVLALLLAALTPVLPAQNEAPGQLKKERPKQATSDKEEIPPEEDAALSNQTYSFNPLQSKKDVQVGDEYAKKHNFHAAAGRYRSATRWDDGNTEAWLKLGESEEKLKDHTAAKQAYAKFVEVATDAKDAKTVSEVRKRMEKLK